MKKVDRLGWTAGSTFKAYGVRIGVRTNSPQVFSLLRERYPPRWKDSISPTVERLYSFLAGGPNRGPGLRRFNLLYRDAIRIGRTLDLEEAVELFESDLQLFVAEAARRRVFVHAGVVGWKGKAVVLPGYSYSGKTTLVVELVKAGATYYSDEYAVLDEEGRVHPYPRALQIRHSDSPRQEKYPVEALGGRAGKEPLPVGLVVVSRFSKDAKWHPRRLPAGRGMLELLANAVSVRRQPEVVMSTVRAAAAGASIFKAARGEAKEVVDFILRQLGG